MLFAVLNQKGGVGKSTTAVHLARWLQLRGTKVHLADMDPQGTGSFWLQAAEQFSIPFTVINAVADAAIEQLPPLMADCEALVVDGPAGLSDATRAVMLMCDWVIVPVQPAGADLRSAVDALRLINQARKIRFGPPDAAVFLNRATKNTRLLTEAKEVINNLEGIRPLSTVIHQRQIITDCYSQATTVFEAKSGPGLEAAAEYNGLFLELMHLDK